MLMAIARFVINLVPEAMADSITRSLAAMTQRPPVSFFEQEAMAQAGKMSYGENKQNVAWFGGMGRWSSMCMDGAAVPRKWLRSPSMLPIWAFGRWPLM